MAARHNDVTRMGPAYAGPPDPWANDGSATLDEEPPFLRPYNPQSEPDALNWTPPAIPMAPPTPALKVTLANGWTAVVENPGSPSNILGRGGQGRVYCAEAFDEHGVSQGEYALKQASLGRVTEGYRLRRTRDGGSEALSEEGRVIFEAGANLLRETVIMQHIYHRGMMRRGSAGVPRTIAYGQGQGSQYMLQERAKGRTLKSFMEADGALPTLQIMRSLLETVTDMEDATPSPTRFRSAVASYRGIVYLDLKPENIMYDPDAGNTRILDGGIAHGRLQKDYEPDSLKGSDVWIAPEQCEGMKQHLQTNQYQLALIWLELRTNGGYSKMRYAMNPGGLPYSYLHQTKNDLHWDGMNQLMMDYDIPYEEQRIMLRALQNDPEKRWPSTQAMLDELVEYVTPAALRPSRIRNLPRLRRISLVPIELPDQETRLMQAIAQPAARARAS